VSTVKTLKRTLKRTLKMTLETDIIGQGERITIKILAELYPNAIIKRQVPLDQLLSQDFIEDMGNRAKKETLDIVLYRPLKNKPLVIRVQDDRHKTKNYAVVDGRQKWELEESNCDVIDIWKEDCPEVFKEKNYDLAKNEIKKILSFYL